MLYIVNNKSDTNYIKCEDFINFLNNLNIDKYINLNNYKNVYPKYLQFIYHLYNNYEILNTKKVRDKQLYLIKSKKKVVKSKLSLFNKIKYVVTNESGIKIVISFDFFDEFVIFRDYNIDNYMIYNFGRYNVSYKENEVEETIYYDKLYDLSNLISLDYNNDSIETEMCSILSIQLFKYQYNLYGLKEPYYNTLHRFFNPLQSTYSGIQICTETINTNKHLMNRLLNFNEFTSFNKIVESYKCNNESAALKLINSDIFSKTISEYYIQYEINKYKKENTTSLKGGKTIECVRRLFIILLFFIIILIIIIIIKYVLKSKNKNKDEIINKGEIKMK